MLRLRDNATDSECNKEDATELFAVINGKNVLYGYLFDYGLDGTHTDYHDSDEVIEETVYVVHGIEHDDISDADEILRAEFWEMFSNDEKAQLMDDRPMRAEAFNNWTDSLCKGGEICEDTYNECSLED